MTPTMAIPLLPLLASACYPPSQIEDPWHEPMRVTVTNVVDGDTIDVDPPVPLPGGDQPRIRLLCVDTPEVDSNECYSSEATEFLEDRILGKKVLLVFEDDDIDVYGRALAYVKHRGALVNLMLTREGYARPIDDWFGSYTWCEDIADAAWDAMEADRGGWGECQGEPWIVE